MKYVIAFLFLLCAVVPPAVYAQRDPSLKTFEGVVVAEDVKDYRVASITVESSGVKYLVNIDTLLFKGDVGDHVEIIYRDAPRLIGTKTYSVKAVGIMRINDMVNGDADRKEGERIMRSYFDERLLQCGDSWYWVERYQSCGKGGCSIRSELHRGKGNMRFSFDGHYTARKTLSLAEKLNGVDPNPVEYEGTMWVIFEAAKCVNCLTDKDWFGGAKTGMSVAKRHGQWMISEFSDPYNSVRKPTCAANGHVLFGDEYLTPKTRFNGDYRLPDLKIR